MKRPIIYILTALIALALPASARIPASQRIRLTDQWEYLKGDLGSIWEAVRAVAPGSSEAVPIWQPVTLPHCFNAEDAVDPDVNYYQGPGWYRTLLDIQNPTANGRTILEFEGAGQKTEVYIHIKSAATQVVTMNGALILQMPSNKHCPTPTAGNVSTAKFLCPSVATIQGIRK